MQQRLWVFGIAICPGIANGGRNGKFILGICRRNFPPQGFCKGFRLHLTDIFQPYRKFVAAQAVAAHLLPQGSFQAGRNLKQQFVSPVVPHGVIDYFQIIDIHHHIGKCPAKGCIRSTVPLECSPVAKTGHHIRIGHSGICCHIGILLNLLAGCNPCCLRQRENEAQHTKNIAFGVGEDAIHIKAGQRQYTEYCKNCVANHKTAKLMTLLLF